MSPRVLSSLAQWEPLPEGGEFPERWWGNVALAFRGLDSSLSLPLDVPLTPGPHLAHLG